MRGLENRFKDLVLSVYLYNEWRGYLQLETELLPALEAEGSLAPSLVQAIRKHAADEKKHYNMFKGYFTAQRRMPFAVGPSVGYFDSLYQVVMGGKRKFSPTPSAFARLCRAVITTERRGIQQIDALLKWPAIRRDERLNRIFEIIRLDEPSHFVPYQNWLNERGLHGPSLLEKTADIAVHYFIALVVIPFHFFNFRLGRLDGFRDQSSSQ